MKKCATAFVDIVNFREGNGDFPANERVRRHLEDGCEICRERLTWLQECLPALHTAVTEDAISAPEQALALARQILRERRATMAQPLLERIAVLLFDSHHPFRPVAVRGSMGPQSQKLYATEDHYVEVWIERLQEGGYYLIGQIATKSGSTSVRPHSVSLIGQDGARIRERPTGTEFHLASVAGGTYEMRLRLDNEVIVMPEVLVGG